MEDARQEERRPTIFKINQNISTIPISRYHVANVSMETPTTINRHHIRIISKHTINTFRLTSFQGRSLASTGCSFTLDNSVRCSETTRIDTLGPKNRTSDSTRLDLSPQGRHWKTSLMPTAQTALGTKSVDVTLCSGGVGAQGKRCEPLAVRHEKAFGL